MSCFLLPMPLSLDQYVMLFVTLHLFVIDDLSPTGQKPQKGKVFALLTAVSPPHRLVPTVCKICPVNTAGWINKLIEIDEAEISHWRWYHCLSSFFKDLYLLENWGTEVPHTLDQVFDLISFRSLEKYLRGMLLFAFIDLNEERESRHQKSRVAVSILSTRWHSYSTEVNNPHRF